ncbi:hypothetical protein RB595_010499 [Gaeumannomyces hyphopodioides]
MSADEPEALITLTLTLTKAEYDRLPDETKAAAQNVSTAKSATRSAGKRGTVIANQGPQGQGEGQVEEQQEGEQLQELLASLSPEKVHRLLAQVLGPEADLEVNQLKDKVARLERQLQIKEQDERGEQLRRLFAEKDKKNKELQAEVERLKKEAEKHTKLGEGVPSLAVPASDDPAKATPDSNASGDPGKDRDEADAGRVSAATPSTANSESAGSNDTPSSPDRASTDQPLANPVVTAPADVQSPPSGPSQDDAAGGRKIDMSDADSAGSSPGAQSPSGNPLSSAPNKPSRHTTSVVLNAERGTQSFPIGVGDLPKRQPMPNLPNPRGPYRPRLKKLIAWAKNNAPGISGVCQFLGKEFVGLWVFDALFPKSSYPQLIYDGSKELDLSRLKTFDKVNHPCFLIILCHVRCGDQLSKEDLDHFVVAIVDWRERETLQSKGRGGPEERKAKGSFTHWGMDENLAKKLKTASEDALSHFELEDISHELDYSGNTCLLECITAVRSYFQEPVPPTNAPLAKRDFYLREVLEVARSRNEDMPSDTPRDSQNDARGLVASSAQARATIVRRPLATSPSLQSVSHRKNGATAGGLSAAPQPDSTSQRDAQHVLATFAPARTPLRKGRANDALASFPSQAASQVQPTSTPPPPYEKGNGECKGMKYQWKPCDGGKILVLKPTPDQYRDFRKGPKDRRPLPLTVAEHLGARNQGVVIIDVPKECRQVLPSRVTQTKQCTIYKPESVGHGFWRLFTLKGSWSLPFVGSDSSGIDSEPGLGVEDHERVILEASKAGKPIKGVAYLTDIPAHTAKERKDAGLPLESPIWPLSGNQLPDKGVPGIQTPTAYEGTAHSVFAWHLEDLFLYAVNILYKGKKRWYVIEPGSFADATKLFCDVLGIEAGHSQFMRHQALHGGVEYLRSQGIRMIGFVQEPGHMVFTYPGAYHSGYSTTPTIAEAINYADLSYTLPDGYIPCDERCLGNLEPITFDLIFKTKANTIPAINEASSALRRSTRQVPPVHTAAGKDSMGSKSFQKRKRSAQGEEQDDSQDERPAKQNNATPSLQAIANELTSQQAKERIKYYAASWKDQHSSRPLQPLANKQPQPGNATPEAYKCFQHGRDLEKKADTSKIVGVLLQAHGLQEVYTMSGGMYDGKGRVKKLPREIIDDLKSRLPEKPSPSAWGTEMKRLRKFLKIGVDWVPLMSCGGSSAALGHIERLQDQDVKELRTLLDSNPEANAFASMGKEFRTMILGTYDREGSDVTRAIDRVLRRLEHWDTGS